MADAAPDGTGFYSIGYSGTASEYGYNYYQGSASAYDCCIAAQNDPDGAQIWYWNFQGSSECYVYTDGGFAQRSQTANTVCEESVSHVRVIDANGFV